MTADPRLTSPLGRRAVLKAAGGAAALAAVGLGKSSRADAASNGFGLTSSTRPSSTG